jgi:hypothetical protein
MLCYSLANAIKKEFGAFIDEFPKNPKEILGFGSLVNDQRRCSEVFNIPKVIKRMEAKIEQMHEKRVSNIIAKVKETRQSLNGNLDFYKNFT